MFCIFVFQFKRNLKLKIMNGTQKFTDFEVIFNGKDYYCTFDVDYTYEFYEGDWDNQDEEKLDTTISNFTATYHNEFDELEDVNGKKLRELEEFVRFEELFIEELNKTIRDEYYN